MKNQNYRKGGQWDFNDMGFGLDSGGRPPNRWRAANEGAWARLFDGLGVRWIYEGLDADLSRAIRYMPDFWLPGTHSWIEIKSDPPTAGEIEAARLLLRATGERVYILAGWPRHGRFMVSIFSEGGDFQTRRPDWCDLAVCQACDCGLGELRRGYAGVRS